MLKILNHKIKNLSSKIKKWRKKPMANTFNAMAMRGENSKPISFKINEKDAQSERRVKSRTHQSFRDEANINNIMKRYKTTGMLVEPGKIRTYRQATFGDFSDLPNLPDTLNRAREADERFLALPAQLRARFNNNVGELLAFVQNPENFDEAVELKLLTAPKAGLDDLQNSATALAKAQNNYAKAKADLEKLNPPPKPIPKATQLKATKQDTAETD